MYEVRPPLLRLTILIVLSITTCLFSLLFSEFCFASETAATSTPAAVNATALLNGSKVGQQLAENVSGDFSAFETITMNTGEIQKAEFSGADSKSLAYSFPNKDLFYQERAYKGGTLSFIVEGTSGTVRYYDEKTKAWNVSALSSSSISYSRMLHVIIDGKELVLCPPYAWKPIANKSIENILSENGTIAIKKEDMGFRITFSWPKLSNAKYSDFFFLSSEEALIDWNNKILSYIWTGYQFSGKDRWCYDGYYFPSPSTYYPSGKNIYNLNPASYTPSRLIQTGGSRAADDLGIAMIDIISRNYVPDGYIPSYAKSKWLSKDYNIGPSYFDDRFNTDLAMAYFVAYQKFGIEKFKEIYLKYADFLVKYANQKFYTVSDKSRTGKMLQDYSYPAGNKGTHCALNHQLAVILFLYKTGDPEHEKTADQLLMGIKITRDHWIKKDGDLNYAFLSNGRYGMKDYPYMTYNDLYLLQDVLAAYQGGRDPDLQILMDSKRNWMEKNGITIYYGRNTK